MRIAVVGSGVSGLASAWLLSRQHEVTLFESEDRLGGHTHTHQVEVAGQPLRVDSGFIVCNELNYPLFFAMLDELGVATQPTTMSFAVKSAKSGLEYNAGSNGGLFVQKRRLFSLRHWRMLSDILRFYRQAPALLGLSGDGPTLGDYLDQNRYSAGFCEDHLIPMASALWSSPSASIRQFPAKYLVAFMTNHHMLQVENRPQWHVVKDGSASYIDALSKRWSVSVRANCPVRSVRRQADGVELTLPSGTEQFDQLVLACHSDQALALLSDASDAEQDILGAIEFQQNDTVLHTDARFLPNDRRAWAAWNALIPAADEEQCTVSYCMNLLQSIDCPEPLVVTLNRSADIDPARVLRRMSYQHPVYTTASVAAQRRKSEISGQRNTWFCGAYWGWGFHEDGMRSAVDVAHALGIGWPLTHKPNERAA